MAASRDQGVDPFAGRHFSSTNTQYVVNYLVAHAPEVLPAVLARAGEERDPATLLEPGTWSTYAQFRRLLEACAAELGDGVLAEFGLDAFAEMSTPETAGMLTAFGSPASLYAEIGPAATGVSPIVTVDGDSVGDTAWLMRMRFHGDFEPFRAYCRYGAGLMGVTPRLFGYPPAVVVEEQCQCLGDPDCVFRITWQEMDGATRRTEQLEVQVQMLQGSLESLQLTVADLVSGAELEEVLARIVSSAARAVRAPAFVLAIETGVSSSQRVYADGLDHDEAAVIADDVLGGRRDTDAHCLVVDLTSTRCTYGRLAALNPNAEFYPQELATLQVYGRLAAAALDAAAAHQETRSQALRAEALLNLSIALAEVASTEEMAQRIAQAVLSVIDCDRALVILADSPSDGRVVGVAGYPAELSALLAGRTFAINTELDNGVLIETSEPSAGEPKSGAQFAMDWTGTVAAAAFPIAADGRVLGFITASVTARPERLTESTDLEVRLRGLGSQARTALANAALLDQVRHQALHDDLTGLPNRTLILDRAEQMLMRGSSGQLPVVAFFIDLDNFKNVNDTLGHSAGDQLLQIVAERLTASVRAVDTVGRLGGDEFIVLAEGASLDGDTEAFAERLLDVLRAPIELAGYEGTVLRVSASIGIAAGPRTSAEQLLRDADIALYRAKAAGRACTVVFEPYMQWVALDRLEIELDLRAHLCEHFELDYQPVFDLQTMAIVGVEALLRWNHPRRGRLMPDVFVPVLEETGMIVAVGNWVLREACTQAVSWQRPGRPCTVSVNVSMRQLEEASFVGEVCDVLSSNGLDPAALVLEVTETSLMRNVEATIDRLTQLKQLGIRIAVDDFGTGYSSLAYLKRLPLDIMKVDQSFVAGIADSPDSLTMVHAMIELAHALGLETLAEGIETPEQLHVLQRERCRTGQGFLLARPMSVEAVDQALAAAAARSNSM